MRTAPGNACAAAIRIEDGVAAVGGGCFDVLGRSRWWGHREECALMQLGVADQTRNIMVLEQRVREYLGRSEAVPSVGRRDVFIKVAYGSSEIDSAQSEICSRCASRSVMTDMSLSWMPSR
jgi:hypothetical protein